MKRVVILLLMALFAVSFAAHAQKKQPTIKELSDRVAKAEAEIKRNESLLKKIKNDRTTTENEIKLIRSRIESRQQIVSLLNEQLSILNSDITSKNQNVSTLETDIGKLRKEYGEMVYAAYKNHLVNNSMAFVFSSQDFNEATLRIDYMKRYNNLRQAKVSELDSVTHVLDSQIKQLGARRDELETTRQARDRELLTLQADEATYKKNRSKLAADEKKISGIIKQKEKEKKSAEAQLQKIISEEAKKSSQKKRSAEDTKAMAKLTGTFVQNKGKFPYPVSGGVVIDRFGEHPHPTQKGLTINNKGVNIAAEKGATVRSIFEGTVSRVIFIKGLNNCVMIQHGEYFTVYSNLASVSVTAGAKVTTNQVIGSLPATADNNDYFIHFEIWKTAQNGATNLNPELWLSR